MRTRKTVIILFSGKAGSGKSTAADILAKKLQDIPSMTVFQYGFADPIKYIAKSFAGWDGQKDERGRKLLQKIGQIFRDYDDNIWVKHFVNQLDKRAGLLPFNFAVVSDWRFSNELAYLKDNPIFDVVTIRLSGRGGLEGETALDVSENSLPDTLIEDLTNSVEHTWSDGNKMSEIYNYVIFNDSDLEQLEIKLDMVLAEITKQYIVE